jgi:hypothetical protein
MLSRVSLDIRENQTNQVGFLKIFQNKLFASLTSGSIRL